ELDGLTADEARALCRLDLRLPDGLARLGITVVDRLQGRMHQRTRLLGGHTHIDEPMLEHLELREELAELLARLEVVDSDLRDGGHGADRFGAYGNGAAIEHVADRGELIFLAIPKLRARRHAHATER